MLVSWRWISHWVDTTSVDPIAFADRFTCTVAEIDHVHAIGQGLEQVLVADVLAVAPHPNADKLRLATVDLGTRHVTVVCGAPDLRVGMRVPFVPPGVTLPSGIAVREGEVRGIPSPGMLASEADLGLSDDHGGLLELHGCSAPAGTSLPKAVQVTDVLYDVDNKAITHRPDLWGQYGMAREVAAMLGQPLQPLDLQVPLGHGAPLDVQVAEDAPCPRYVCARIEGVQVAPSSVDLRLQLRRCGVRPISNVVDATNLVMLETGNPLHAFDARHVRGDTIRVRRAHAGESITTLDGTVRALLPADCVIADAEGPVALAGIMGGADSEIRADTQTVVLEAAAFDAPAIRKTAMRLGMRTESSARFEKALDPALPDVAARRFLRLLLTSCPTARVTSDLGDYGPYHSAPPAVVTIATSASYLRQRLGVDATEMPDAWIDKCLTSLEFHVARQGDLLTATVPSFRATKDVRIAEDLVEELGRHYGYQRIASQPPLVPARPPHTPPLRLLERKARDLLVHAAGMTEVLLYGFDHEHERDRLGLREPGLPRLGVCNTIASDMKHLRRNLAPNLLAAIQRNLQHGDGRQAPREGLTIGLFEIGRAFVPVPDRELSEAETAAVDPGLPPVLRSVTDATHDYLGRMDPEMRASVLEARDKSTPLPWQPMRLGIALGVRLGGGAEGSKVSRPPLAVTQDVFARVVGAVQAVVHAAGVGVAELRNTQALHAQTQLDGLALPDLHATWWHPRRMAEIRVGGQSIGLLAAVHPRVRQALDVPAEIVIAELNLEALLGLPQVRVEGKAPPQFPASTFDVTVPLATTHKSEHARQVLLAETAALGVAVETVRLVDVFQREAEPDRRFATYRVVCRAAEGTLSPQQLAVLSEQVRGRYIDPQFWLTALGSR
jgi:phenylalanyl-tRNA synthetase beta chain